MTTGQIILLVVAGAIITHRFWRFSQTSRLGDMSWDEWHSLEGYRDIALILLVIALLWMLS